uniref:Uncharacterized protein n=1 Tax=Strombidium inclinatum TaxID=197538 RepID=A0A7S3IIV4_9SPIT|mmetsp:Transcript_21850/g.33850  ORF Transcript_21850/g.33850 Transcript_21850/m.33850 type:complete len:233 (+) Transcript_21850:755-1453(+)
MAAESETVLDPYNILTVFMVAIPQGLQDFDFNLALLVQLLPVLQNLYCDVLLVLVVVASQHHSEGTPAQLLLDFIAIQHVVLGLIEVVGLVVIETVVVDLVGGRVLILRILILASELVLHILANSLVLSRNIEIVDHIVIRDLILLILAQLSSEKADDLITSHREGVGRRLARLSGLLMHELLLLQNLTIGRLSRLDLNVFLIRKIRMSELVLVGEPFLNRVRVLASRDDPN